MLRLLCNKFIPFLSRSAAQGWKAEYMIRQQRSDQTLKTLMVEVLRTSTMDVSDTKIFTGVLRH